VRLGMMREKLLEEEKLQETRRDRSLIEKATLCCLLGRPRHKSTLTNENVVPDIKQKFRWPDK
jgi:hypothetical protein